MYWPSDIDEPWYKRFNWKKPLLYAVIIYALLQIGYAVGFQQGYLCGWNECIIQNNYSEK